MGLFDTVVVGVDGTAFGTEALRQSLALAPPDAAVYAVTALDTTIAVHGGFSVSHITAELEQEAAQAVEEAAALLGDRTGGTRLVRGNAKSVLASVCDEVGATLLALGGRSSSRLLGLMVGETAGTLLHRGARSVLIARPPRGEKVWSPARIVVGVDGSTYSAAALAAADDLGTRCGSTVTVVAASGGKPIESSGGWSSRVTDWAPERAADALRSRAEDADLLVLGSRGLHGVRALGSVSERVAHSASCSVLVVHSSPSD